MLLRKQSDSKNNAHLLFFVHGHCCSAKQSGKSNRIMLIASCNTPDSLVKFVLVRCLMTLCCCCYNMHRKTNWRATSALLPTLSGPCTNEVNYFLSLFTYPTCNHVIIPYYRQAGEEYYTVDACRVHACVFSILHAWASSWHKNNI